MPDLVEILQGVLGRRKQAGLLAGDLRGRYGSNRKDPCPCWSDLLVEVPRRESAKLEPGSGLGSELRTSDGV
jgi:hypothetical protein